MVATQLSFDSWTKADRDVEKLQILVERHWQSVQPDSLGLLRLAVSDILFLFPFTYRLIRIERAMRLIYRNAKDELRLDSLSRDDTLKLAQFFAEIANRLFALARKDRQIIDRTMQVHDSWAVHVVRWCWRKREAHHEKAGCFAEDAAETLALSASKPFTDLVRQEINECTQRTT